MIEGLLFKGNSQSIADVDEVKGIVTGYFSSFDVVDSDGDVITKGAFSKTIKEMGPTGSNRIKHLINHDINQMPAKVLELHEDATGLTFVSKAGTHTLGQDWLKMCMEGLYTEHSIGFKVVRNQKGEFHGERVNYITEIKLFEGSTVTWGANQFTPITGVKSLEDVVSLFYKLEKVLRTGTFTDETFEKIQEQYDLIGKILAEFVPGSGGESSASIEANRDETTQPELDGATTEPSAEELEKAEKARKAEIENQIINEFKKALEGNGRGE